MFWQCTPDSRACLHECPPYEGGILSFNPELSVCDWPENVDCTTVVPTQPGPLCWYEVERSKRFPSLFFNIGDKTVTDTAQGCQDRCDESEECVAFTWNGDWAGSCFIKSRVTMEMFQIGAVSGKKVCQ